MRKTEFYLFILILIILGCEEPTRPLGSSDVLIPLEVGNYWKYKSIVQYDSSKTDTIYSNIEVKSKTKVGDKFLYSYKDPIEFRVYNNLEDGYYENILGADSIIYSTLIYKYPADGYVNYSENCQAAYVDSLSYLISVEAGTFHCKKYTRAYQCADPYAIINTFIAPGIGIVKEETRQVDDRYYSVKELRSYFVAR